MVWIQFSDYLTKIKLKNPEINQDLCKISLKLSFICVFYVWSGSLFRDSYVSPINDTMLLDIFLPIF